MNTNSDSSFGIITLIILGIIFVTLKTKGIIAISWWWFIAPFGILLLILIVILILILVSYIKDIINK